MTTEIYQKKCPWQTSPYYPCLFKSITWDPAMGFYPVHFWQGAGWYLSAWRPSQSRFCCGSPCSPSHTAAPELEMLPLNSGSIFLIMLYSLLHAVIALWTAHFVKLLTVYCNSCFLFVISLSGWCVCVCVSPYPIIWHKIMKLFCYEVFGNFWVRFIKSLMFREIELFC